jgi:outer membrane protein
MNMKIPPGFFKKLCIPLLAVPLMGHAQNIQKISLADAINKGLQQSRILKIDHSRIDAALARYDASKDGHLPEVKLSAGYTYLSDLDHKNVEFGPISFPLYENNNFIGRASVNEAVFAGYRQRYAEESSRLLAEAAKLDVEKDRDDVMLNIINAYFTLYKAQSTKKEIDNNIVLIQQRLKEVQDALNRGVAIQNDVLRVQLLLSNTQLAQVEAVNNINTINFNLNILLGLPTGTGVEPDSASMFSLKNMKTGEEYIKDALSQRQELKANDTRTKAAEENIKIAQGSYYPTVGVGADFYYANPNQRYFPVLPQFKPSWDAGINLSWNVTTMFTNKHQIAEANASLMQSRVVNDLEADNIKMEVNASYISYIESLKKTEIAKLAVAQAEENYRTLTSRYNNQVALLSDLLDANNLLLQARINETLSVTDSELTYKKLLKATGNLKP